MNSPLHGNPLEGAVPSLFLVHYDEVGLKGRNRAAFEALLARNIRFALWGLPRCRVERLPGRLAVLFSESLSPAQVQDSCDRLARVVGVANFSPALRLGADWDVLEHRILTELESRRFETFGVLVRRSDKRLPFKSVEVAARLGEAIVRRFGSQVDLEGPDLWVYVEVMSAETFLYFEKRPGVGGLPLNPRNRVAVMISGGIDSPVAAFRILKRGCMPVFVHFHSAPYTGDLSVRKVQEIAEVLCRHRCRAPLYLVPIAEFQRRMVAGTRSSLRVLLYRRLMFRVAEVLAQREGALAIVTGESLGQVASQTLQNQRAIGAAIDLPILRPLIGMDKREIIEEARAIGTYEMSIEPQGDSCSYLLPSNPATHASVEALAAEEARLPVLEWVSEAVQAAECTVVGAQQPIRSRRGRGDHPVQV